MSLARLLCLINRHRPGGRNAEWDGLQYIGKCGRCSAAIRRVRKGVWVRNREVK